jgi:hypothetical protein
MKLIFLGDSFTYGWGIDKEYGIKNNLIKNDNDFTKETSNNSEVFNFLNDFRINNNWTSLISKELKLECQNRSIPGSGIEMIYSQFLESEFNNEKEKFYIIGLPITLSARKLTSSKNNQNHFADQNSFSQLFNTYSFKDNSEDIIFFKKYFDENYFSFTFINIISSIINYCKNKKIKFIFLPTWHQSIKKHLLLNDNQIIKKYLEKFIFNEIEEQINFSIDIHKIKKLSCGHPNIESQVIIKNIYLNHIKRILK